MKNIHVLSTNKPSRLHYSKIKNNDKISYKLVLKKEFSKCNDGLLSGQRHIYITSDEEIKELDKSLLILEEFEPMILTHYEPVEEGYIGKKIIITTDQDLIKDGVQAIDDEFLQWFVKNPNCEQISVEEVYFHGSGYYKASELSEQEREKYSFMKKYKIIIPKEEDFELVSIGEDTIKLVIPMIQDKEENKQETVEEAAERLYPTTINSFTDSGFDMSETERLIFINGAKWQQEQEQSNENSWFNEYQEVENYIIKRIGNKFLEATPDKYKTASEATIALLKNNWQKEKSYSEEDMKQFGLYLGDNLKKLKGKTIDEIFEQFKKK